MAKILFESEDGFKKKFKKLLTKRSNFDSDIDKIVEDIIQKVKTKSDSAVLKLTKNLDKNKVKNFDDLIVSQKEINASLDQVENKVLSSLKKAIKRITAYH